MLKSHFAALLQETVLLAVDVLLFIGAVGIATGSVTNPPTIYNTIPNGLLSIPPTEPGNVLSVGFEAVGVREFGDGLNLAGTQRNLTTVKVILSSFACPMGHWGNPTTSPNACVTPPGPYSVESGITVTTFSQLITLNIYASNGATPPEPGALLASVKQTFQIPYRPSTSALCDAIDPGGWFSTANNSCYNGLANPITFDLTALGIVLPDQIIVSVAYNTSTAGYNPIGTGTACFGTVAGCPYDSLNVSADTTAATAAAGHGIVFVGTPFDPNGVYVNYIPPTASKACSPASPAAAGNAFLLDTGPGCWATLHPEIMVNASFGPQDSYQVRYAANIHAGGDSYVDITNSGASGGTICVNIYGFDAQEELVSCCACPVTPNGLVSLSARSLTNTALTGTPPNELVIKLLSSTSTTNSFGAPTCNTTPTSTNLAPGMLAWGTTVHSLSTLPATYATTETPFAISTLSAAELSRVTTSCEFIQILGSGQFGICKGCQTGGL